MGLLAYATDYVPEDEPLLAARAYAAELGGTEPVSPPVGATLRFLACAVGARTVVEIGTGCGSSGIWLLRGMRVGGTLTSVDIEPEYQRMARKALKSAERSISRDTSSRGSRNGYSAADRTGNMVAAS